MEKGNWKMEKGAPESSVDRRQSPAHFPFSLFPFPVFFSVFICVHLWLIPPAQAQEVVVNLSAGRVIVCVAKKGIVIATVQKSLEAEARPPILAQLSGRRVTVLLGATEWISPAGEPPVRMEREIPRVSTAISGEGPTLSREQSEDLQAFALAVLEPLREAAQRLTQKVNLARDEPLLDIVLIGYLENYGAETWTMRYRAVQEPFRGEYWQTRVLRPISTQLYPPEKGDPRTIMEVRYPPQDDTPLLLDLLRRNDPRLARLRNIDKPTSEAALKILEGESHKAPLEGVVTLLRGALEATLEPGDVLAFGVIDEIRGFEWVIPQREVLERAEEERKERPAGAPTLRKPPE